MTSKEKLTGFFFISFCVYLIILVLKFRILMWDFSFLLTNFTPRCISCHSKILEGLKNAIMDILVAIIQGISPLS